MNDTHTSSTEAGRQQETRGNQRRRRLLVGLIAFATVIALFYAEENWRGRRAWDDCKRELTAKGARLDWAYYIPPSVPEDQNIFGVPEMSRWFVGRVATDLTARLTYPGYTNSERMVVAHITLGLPAATPSPGAAVLPWKGERSAQTDAAGLIVAALGPMTDDAATPCHFIRRNPGDVQAVRLFFRCDKLPTEAELAAWLTGVKGELGAEGPKLEPTGENSYRLTVVTPIKASEFVSWGARIEPELAIMREAVKRPYARIPGNYENPYESPIPNFVSLRNTVQRLSSLAKCHLLLNQPEQALEQLTLIHGLCGMLEARPTRRPLTLVAAMIHVAVKGLYVDTIKEGMRLHAWTEPQLAALQRQLGDTNLRSCVAEAFSTEQASMIGAVEKTPKAELWKFFRLAEIVNGSGHARPTGGMAGLVYGLIPQGWVDQNLASFARLEEVIKDSLDPKREDVEPRKIDAVGPTIEAAVARPTPYKFLAAIAIPNFVKASSTMAYRHVQILEGQIACALERYRLAHGEYPQTLDELTPGILAKVPQDPIGPQPFHYRRPDATKFTLYSVGWNEKDDGGGVSASTAGAGEMNRNDWVWQSSGLPTP